MQRRRGLALGRPLGFPLLVHGSWLPAAALIAAHAALSAFAGRTLVVAIALGLLTAAILFVCVVLHELAHALIARRKGIETLDATLYVFGGLARTAPQPSDPRSETAIAAAGPLASALLGGAFAVGGMYAHGYVADVCRTVAVANIAFTLFNLLPGLPLDGGRLLVASRWRAKKNRARAIRFATRTGRAIGIVMAVVGVWLIGNSFAFAPDAAASLWLILAGAFVFSRASEARNSGLAGFVGDATVGSWARSFAGRVLVHDTVPDGGGPYAVSDGGRLAGVLTTDSLKTNQGSVAGHVMTPWTADVGVSASEPLEHALERLAAGHDTVLVVLDENGVVRGVLDTEAVREGIGVR
jgi:Zn-dependent protease